jgi:hypothetical protein
MRETSDQDGQREWPLLSVYHHDSGEKRKEEGEECSLIKRRHPFEGNEETMRREEMMMQHRTLDQDSNETCE